MAAYINSLDPSVPAVPTPHLNGANVAVGANLFSLNCAACHTITGAGDALAFGTNAPSLQDRQVTAQQVAEAIRTGPANMPRFSGNLTDAQVRDVVAYVTQSIQHPAQSRWRRPGRRRPGGRGLHRPADRRRRSGPHLLLDRRALVSDEHEHEPTRTKVPMPVATLSDPHLGDAARHPSRVEAIIALILVVAIVLTAGFGVAFTQNWNPWILGGTLGAGMFLLGFGLTAWGKYLMPQGPFVEERHVLASSPEERNAMSAALVERSAVVVKRRKLLGGLFAVGAGIFGIVAMFPLLRSLGPLPGTSLDRTNWRKGSLLVDSNGRAVDKGTLVVGGIMTVYPDKGSTPPTARPSTRPCLSGSRTPTWSRQRAGRPGPPRATWPTPSCAPTSGARSASTSSSSSCWSAPATSPCSTCATARCPSSVPLPARCPSCRSTSTPKGNCAAQAGYDQAVGPGFYERTTTKVDGT